MTTLVIVVIVMVFVMVIVVMVVEWMAITQMSAYFGSRFWLQALRQIAQYAVH